MSKLKQYSLRVGNFIIATLLSVWLLEMAGVDIAQANILNFESFSLPVLILLGLSLESFNGVFCTIWNWYYALREGIT